MSGLPMVLQNKIYGHYFSTEVLVELLQLTKKIKKKLDRSIDYGHDTSFLAIEHTKWHHKIRVKCTNTCSNEVNKSGWHVCCIGIIFTDNLNKR
jgi:hypothetical protein